MQSSAGGHLSGKPALARYAKLRRAGDLLFVAGVSGRAPDNSVPGVAEDAVGARVLDVRAQTEAAIDEADLSLFLIDAKMGLTPADETLASILRKRGKPVVV